MLRPTGTRHRPVTAVAAAVVLCALGVWGLHQAGPTETDSEASAPSAALLATGPDARSAAPAILRPAPPKPSLPPFTNRPFGPPELRVLVRDEFDRPIAEARVEASWPGQPLNGTVDVGRMPMAMTSGITGPFGRMEVWGIPDGPVVVRVRASGFVPSDGIPASIVRGRTAELRVELEIGTPLEGEVRGEHGEPAAGTSLELAELTGDQGASSLRTLVNAPATSDEQGRFRIDGLRPGRYRLSASRGHQRAALGVALPSGTVLVRLRSGEHPRARLSGRVLAPDEQPVRCRVWAERRERPSASSGSETEDGGFELSLEPGDYDVLAACSAPWRSARAMGRAFVSEGGETQLDLKLEAGLQWSGQVLDETGMPVEGATVWAELAGGVQPGSAPSPESVARSDAEGRFVLEGLAAASYRVAAQRGTRIVETMASPTGGPISLTLPPEPWLRGRVVGPDGSPVRRYRVNGREFTDDDGRFSYERWVEESELRIIALDLGSAVVRLASKRGTEDVGTIVLTAEGSASGRVVDARTGAPISGAHLEPGVKAPPAMVGFEQDNGGLDVAGSARSDAAGRFRYPHAAGTPVLVSHPAYMRVEILLAEGENVIALEPAAVVEGRVASATEPTCVSALGAARRPITSTTGPGGGFRISGLDRGTWEVRAGCDQEGYPAEVRIAGPGTYRVVVPPPGDP